ncbi:hypothetical protein [Chryseobacterium sp. HMWF035]|uniref:hypothetical protein n=1 Tax=Chryseobacterium sp. HMWF035 TaxID=2056868 RepID=UPI000D571511|nr:hypothetical protein [Chryseobacterium sp. HMWF035]PVV55983.1 hypothetical protein DD829_12385 [Chryseobacterium sp. HMWF035]
MKNKHIYLLLEIIKNNGNVKRLTHEGLRFSEIADLTSKVIADNYAEYIEDNIVLTEIGTQFLSTLTEDFKERDKNNWIIKENKSKIKKIDKDFIYLPNLKELSF